MLTSDSKWLLLETKDNINFLCLISSYPTFFTVNILRIDPVNGKGIDNMKEPF